MFLPGLVLLVCVWSPVEPACGPVEEGQPTTLTCNVNTAGCNPSNRVLLWRAQTSLVDVISCFTDACGGGYSPNFISATISPTSSTLTINSISRTDPFNMETKWTCHPCSPRPAVTVCDKLQVYAKPISPSCTVTENPESGEIMSVTVTCSTNKVYPAAKCHFDKIKNGGQPVRITQTIDYETPTPTSTTPVYYNSECSVTVSVQELGEGSHDFLGFIYPDVTDGHSLVDGISPDKTVTLSFPQASHTCTTDTFQGYFIGKSAICTCTITSDGNPRGTARWYRGDNPVGTAGTTATVDVPYDKNNAEQTYTCEAKSNLGRKTGSTLKAKFAFLDQDSVQVEPPLSPIKLCDDNTKTAQVTCRISKENVRPAALTFSFSRDGLSFEDSKPGTESSDGIYYQREFSFSQDVGGEYPVYCRVVNTILNTNERGDTRVTFQKPPSGPAQVTVDGQSYQGTAQSNIVTLIEGYTGDVTCRVEGGYPSVTNTHLKCGQREITGDRNTATLGYYDNPLRRDWNGKECSCTSQHVSGCYSNRDTKLTLNVLYPPNVTFSKDPTATIFNKGNRVVLTCSAQGNPDPSLTLTTESTNGTVILANVQTSTLTHTLNSLDCLDTGVYVCSGQNSRGTNPKDISINVRCPQQLSPTFDPPPIIDAVMDDTAEIDVDIYGFPEPSSLYLEKTIDKTSLMSSPRHTVKYTAKDAPFGVVTVTIFDIVEADYTNYTLTVDNSVEETLIYNFYLNKVKPNRNEDNTDLPEITFTKDSIETIFNKGDRVVLTCSVQYNTGSSLTLTRVKSNEVLAKVQTSTLTYILDSLDCLDTGVYVCSGQNSRGTNSKEISLNVRCPQQFSPSFDPPSIIDAVVSDDAQINLEIHGFPEPSSLSLRKTTDNTKITSLPRHTIKYTASDVPFGVVTVTIFDIVDTDYTNYTLTVDNGVGEALLYKFYLNKGKGMNDKPGGDSLNINDKPGGDSLNIPAVIIGVIALVILATLVVIIVFLVNRNRNLTKWKVKDPDLYLVPIDTSDIVNNVQTPENPRTGQYEDVDGVQYTTRSTPISTGLTPGSRQDRDTNATLPHTHTVMVSASQPPETGHYESLPDITPASGPYNSTSLQDVEPPNIYRRPIPDTSSTRHGTPSGDYNNIPGQHGQTPDSHISSPSAGAAMTSLPNRSYNNVILPSLAGSTRDNIDVKQAYQNVKLK